MDAAEDMKLLGKGQRTLLLKVKAVAVALPLCYFPHVPQALQRTHPSCLPVHLVDGIIGEEHRG